MTAAAFGKGDSPFLAGFSLMVVVTPRLRQFAGEDKAICWKPQPPWTYLLQLVKRRPVPSPASGARAEFWS